jgi:hypothetical protein
MTTPDDPILTNADVYREIAVESLRSAEFALDAHKRRKENGSPGFVLSYDPARTSFKHSMIAIVFAGMCIEARLWLYGSQRLGVAEYTPIDRLPLEQRLAALGIVDEALEADVKTFRLARKDLVHEKAVPLSLDQSPARIVQKEAATAVNLIFRVERALAETLK